MTLAIIIFLVSIISLFGILAYQAEKIRKSKIEKPPKEKNFLPIVYFRQVEKIVLYWVKRWIQWLILTIVKYWTILVEESKKIVNKKLPKTKEFFKKLKRKRNNGAFFRKAKIESKFKIKRLREKIKKEYENDTELGKNK